MLVVTGDYKLVVFSASDFGEVLSVSYAPEGTRPGTGGYTTLMSNWIVVPI